MRHPEHGHWTDAYRTDPLRLYEMEAPVFENHALTLQEVEKAAALAGRLGTALTSPLLDLACGPGRHSRALTERSLWVCGLDLSAGFLSRAQVAGSRQGGEPSFVCGDLLDLPVRQEAFRTALLLGKGFGYFEDEDNERVLRGTFEVLEPGGFFCVELPDRDAYLAGLPEVETIERPLSDGRPVRSRWVSEWCAAAQRLRVEESHLLIEGGEVFWEGRWDVRLYDAPEVESLLTAAGFQEVRVESVELVEVEGARSEVLFAGARR